MLRQEGEGLAGSLSVATIPTTPPSVLAVGEPSVQMMNYAFRRVMGDV